MRKRVIGGLVAAAVALGIGGTITVADAASSANSATCNSTSYDGSTLNITCQVPQVTVTKTVAGPTVTKTVTKTKTVTPSPSPTTTTSSASPTTTAPASPTPTPTDTPPPVGADFPNATNTGPVAGTVLKRVPEDVTSGPGWHYDTRGWVEVDGEGATFNGFITNVGVDVTANNVTISNNSVTCADCDFGISLRNTTNAVVKNNIVKGTNATTGRIGAGIKDIFGDDINPKILANNIYYTSTGVQGDTGLIQDNYIHDMGFQNGDHLNGQTDNGGDGPLTINHNTILNSFGQTDAISLFQDFGGNNNKTITNNFLAGGGYTIYAGGPNGCANPAPGKYKCDPSSNIVITGNQISTMYFPQGGGYGPLANFYDQGKGNVWANNTWADGPNKGKVISD